jgi:hypothetical protein
MPYSLNNFDGRVFAVLDDGVVDRQASSSLYLIGKSVTGYGTFQNDNFLWLLENFAGTVEPANKLQGQLWFDKTEGVMKPKVYDGTEWRSFTMMSVAGTAPTAPTVGDFWFNNSTDELFLKNTPSTFLPLGREGVPGYGTTRMASVEILDTTSVGHACIIIYSNGEIVGAVSNDDFDVKSTEAAYIAGIIHIGRGFTFVGGASITSDSTFAQQIVDETISGNWSFTNDAGIFIKNSQIYSNNSDLTFNNAGHDIVLIADNILSSGNSTILGSSTSKFAKIYTSEISGGTSISPVTLTGQFNLSTSSKILPASDNTAAMGAANARWASMFTTTLSAGGYASVASLIGNWQLEGNSTLDLSLGNFKTTTLTTGDAGTAGTMTGNWSLTNDSNITLSQGNIVLGTGVIDATLGTLKSTTLSTGGAGIEGIITGAWKFSSGSSLNATYADIAERYSTDADYEPGTVVMFGGSAEVTVANVLGTDKVVGIVTTNPFQTLNAELENSVAIALIGRVPCKVVGTVHKGDTLMASDTPGAATKLETSAKLGSMIAKALQDYDSDQVGVIEVMVYRG